MAVAIGKFSFVLASITEQFLSLTTDSIRSIRYPQSDTGGALLSHMAGGEAGPMERNDCV